MGKSPRFIGADEIAHLVAERSSDVFTVPESWQDTQYRELDSRRRYTVSTMVTIPGVSVFGAKPMEVRYHPQAHDMRFGRDAHWHEVSPEQAGNGVRNIVLGTRHRVGICEHSLALRTMGIEADIELVGATNFPNHDHGVKTELAAILPYLVDVGPAPLRTVHSPVGVDFGDGRYVALLPDDGSHVLQLDHQFSHAGNVLGTQRLQQKITAPVVACMAAARTICYKWLLRNALLFSEKLGSPHERILHLTRQNVLLVSSILHNPRDQFTEPGGTNREALLHEGIDKLGAAALVPGRLVGTMITHSTNHARDIEALQMMSAAKYLVPVSSSTS